MEKVISIIAGIIVTNQNVHIKLPVCEPVCEVVENKEKTLYCINTNNNSSDNFSSGGALGQQQGGHHNTINNIIRDL